MNAEILRSIYELSPIAIVLTDTNWNIRYANAAYLKLSGFNLADLEALNLLQWLHLEGVLAMATGPDEPHDDPASPPLEQRVLRKDGTPAWVQVQSRAPQPAAEESYCVHFITDITPQKEKEQALLIQSQAISSAKAGFLIANPEGKIMYVNQAFLTITGYQHADEIVGKMNNQLAVTPGDLKSIVETVQRQGYWAGELQTTKADGSPLHVEVTVYLIRNQAGVPVGRLTSVTDITQRKEVELALRQLNQMLELKNHELLTHEQELEMTNEELTRTMEDLYASQQKLELTLKELNEKNFELDQFVYKTSHDLRSPLSTVLGLVTLLKSEESDTVKDYYISLIENRIVKLDRFIKSMLDYAKSTRTKIQVEPIEFDALITECLQGLEYMKDFGRLKITVQRTGHDFHTDAFRLKVLLANLISNAVKYQDHNREHRFLRIRVRAGKKFVLITVTDNGIGIQREHLDKIFTMFYRATDNAEGAGLGMYIVKQTVQHLQGAIRLRSEFGQGTEVNILLPNLQSE